MARWLFAAMLLAIPNADVLAHARSESYSNWQLGESTVSGTITVTSGELTALIERDNTATLEDLFVAHLRDTVDASGATGPCDRVGATPLAAPRGFVRIELVFACASPGLQTLRYRALFDAQPSHVHFARFFAQGAAVSETVLTDRADTWVARNTRHSLPEFLELGVRHILSGIDHIAFLIGLLLIAGTVRRGVVAVTGFTLGHSISLAAAVLGYVRADGRLVEAFIGFTVVLVALEFFQRHHPKRSVLGAAFFAATVVTAALAVSTQRVPSSALAAYGGFGLFAYAYLLGLRSGDTTTQADEWLGLSVVTTCFGLVHGFGFAGFLVETGLGVESLLIPLLGFNLGVELGQLVLLSAFVIVAKLLGERTVAHLSPVMASALCALGTYWFIGRSLSL